MWILEQENGLEMIALAGVVALWLIGWFSIRYQAKLIQQNRQIIMILRQIREGKKEVEWRE
jgi:hypothetical protein